MFRVALRFRWRLAACALCFAVGLALAFAYAMLPRLFARRAAMNGRAAVKCVNACSKEEADETFSSPDELVAALKSEDVGVRRDTFRRLFLRPGMNTVYYDYERDRDF